MLFAVVVLALAALAVVIVEHQRNVALVLLGALAVWVTGRLHRAHVRELRRS